MASIEEPRADAPRSLYGSGGKWDRAAIPDLPTPPQFSNPLRHHALSSSAFQAHLPAVTRPGLRHSARSKHAYTSQHTASKGTTVGGTIRPRAAGDLRLPTSAT